MKPPYAIGSVPSLSGHAVAYRWRSLPRVRRHRASKPQGSSERVLPWQITMDQLIFASLSHTHYWYEVGMLKVPAVFTNSMMRLLHPLYISLQKQSHFGSSPLEYKEERECRTCEMLEDMHNKVIDIDCGQSRIRQVLPASNTINMPTTNPPPIVGAGKDRCTLIRPWW